METPSVGSVVPGAALFRGADPKGSDFWDGVILVVVAQETAPSGAFISPWGFPADWCGRAGPPSGPDL